MEGGGRFGIAQSATFASVTTLFTTGSVYSMHDSYTPLGGLGAFIGIMLQCVFGGKGVGFLPPWFRHHRCLPGGGLDGGHTPQFLGKKIEKPEIVLVSLTLLMTRWRSLLRPGGRWLRLWRRRDGQCRHPRLFEGAVCLYDFGRQQRLCLRRTERQHG